MPRPVAKFRRKVIHRNLKTATPKVSIPRWWIGDCEEVTVEIYADKVVIKRIEGDEE